MELCPASDGRSKASALKNKAIVHCRIIPTLQKPQDLLFHVQQGHNDAKLALEIGQGVQTFKWCRQQKDHVDTIIRTFSETVAALEVPMPTRIEVFERAFHALKSNSPDLHFHMASLCVKQGVLYMADNAFPAALRMAAIGEGSARVLADSSECLPEDGNPVQDLAILYSSANAVQLLQKGNEMVKGAVEEDEDLRVEQVWQAIDCFRACVVAARGHDVETEAMAHSSLGFAYDQV